MIVVVGATGHIGRALCGILASSGQAVLAVSRDAEKARAQLPAGVEVAQADVGDVAAMRAVFSRGRRAFLLNPPGDPSGDAEAEELATGEALAAAVEGAGLEAVVAASAYGARPEAGTGDLGTLHAFEQALLATGTPVAFARSAYYMSNFDASLEEARADGRLTTLLPRDLVMPMVAPHDIAAFAAGLLQAATPPTGVHPNEGPARRTPADVADAFSAALGKPVELVSIPRDDWVEHLRGLGFSQATARSFARMTAITVDELERPAAPRRGDIALEDYIAALAAADDRTRGGHGE